MRFNRGSFSFKLFAISILIGIIFALISVLANNYFINRIVFKVTEERANSTLNYIEHLLKSEERDLNELNLTTLFQKGEMLCLALYDENGKLLSKTGSYDCNAPKVIPSFRYSSSKDENGYYNFIKKVFGIRTSNNISDGYLVLALDLRYVKHLVEPINQFRIYFFISIILLLLVFIYYTTRHLVIPIERAIMTLRDMTEKGFVNIDIDDDNYDEIKEILYRFRDIQTSLNSIQFNFRTSEERLKTLLNKTGDVILMLDENFKIEYASSTFNNILGIDLNRAESRLPFSEFLTNEERRRLLPYLRKILRGESSQDFQLKLKDKNGEEVFLLTSWILRENLNHKGGGIIIFGKNITEHKKIEEILRKRTEALETILFSLSHDLKGPVFTLKGMTTLFKQQYYNSLNEQGQHFIDRINESILKLERMISNMLDIIRFERQVFKMEEVNLNELIGYLCSDMKDYIEECNAELRLLNELPIIKGDKDKIYIVFKNLLENALKYRSTDRKCIITIEAKSNEKGVEILFEDNGIGIESSFLDKLFKPFSRAGAPSHNMPSGYGIGLAIVKGILDAHNSEIKVESSYGEWTKFRIFFDRSMLIG
ncbi:MAG: sensor histidine kinase [Myxococcota bacterium]